MKKKTFAYISIVYAVCAAPLNADNLYFIGTGDSAAISRLIQIGELTAATP